MNYLLFFLVQWLAVLPAIAGLDPTLLQEVEHWKAGEKPPSRLLKFPDGKIDEFPTDGFKIVGTEVFDYISEIKNTDLLAALLLDDRARPDTVRAAAWQLINLRGVKDVAGLLASRKRGSLRPDLAVLAELLRSPYASVQVARITKDDMDLTAAERALHEMRIDLEAGVSWADAYGKASNKHRDPNDPDGAGTLVCYLYDGIVSPTGFDILEYRVASDLPQQHLVEVFRAGGGTHILSTSEAVYLYHVKPQ